MEYLTDDTCENTNIENRKCEICGHNDCKSMVVCSGVGPISFNTCVICATARAEVKEFSEEYQTNYYDPKSDTYKNYKHETLTFDDQSGHTYTKRSEILCLVEEE